MAWRSVAQSGTTRATRQYLGAILYVCRWRLLSVYFRCPLHVLNLHSLNGITGTVKILKRPINTSGSRGSYKLRGMPCTRTPSSVGEEVQSRIHWHHHPSIKLGPPLRPTPLSALLLLRPQLGFHWARSGIPLVRWHLSRFRRCMKTIG